MATIAVIIHECDRYPRDNGKEAHALSPYLLKDILDELAMRGHKILITDSSQPRPDSDVAIVHIDTTYTPAASKAFARMFPVSINCKASDISKRKISGAIVGPSDRWPGPVIVKSNLNYLGLPEQTHNQRAEAVGKPLPFPDVEPVSAYAVYKSLAEVPRATFKDAGLVVERFIPELEPDGFATRFWVFCGDRERCTRYVSSDQLVKGSNITRKEAVPVPEELRIRRRRLGFDYGKFDFVVHEGKAVLLDANRTPGRPPSMTESGADYLATGLECLIESRMIAPSAYFRRLRHRLFT